MIYYTKLMAVNLSVLILVNITKYIEHCIVYKRKLELNKVLYNKSLQSYI